MHNRHNPDDIRLFKIDDGVGKNSAEMSPDRRVKSPESSRLHANLGNQPLDFIIKPATQFWGNVSVVSRRFGVFDVSLPMETMRFHRPTILRIRAETSSPGMPFSWPLSISATRRRVSRRQLSSISGAIPPCSLAAKWSTNSTNCSRGSWLLSCTICAKVIAIEIWLETRSTSTLLTEL